MRSILGSVDDIINQLEEDTVTLATMQASRYVRVVQGVRYSYLFSKFLCFSFSTPISFLLLSLHYISSSGSTSTSCPSSLPYWMSGCACSARGWTSRLYLVPGIFNDSSLWSLSSFMKSTRTTQVSSFLSLCPSCTPLFCFPHVSPIPLYLFYHPLSSPVPSLPLYPCISARLSFLPHPFSPALMKKTAVSTNVLSIALKVRTYALPSLSCPIF